MREILFRGKRKDNGEWVEGNLVNDNNLFNKNNATKMDPYILTADGDDYDTWHCLDYEFGYCEVIPETVGQYTGLKDKNDKMIFEGDIIETYGGECYQGCWEYKFITILYNMTDYDSIIALYNLGFSEIIGNIHDNPELLEEAK